MNVLRPGYYASHPSKRIEFQLLLLAKSEDPDAARAAANSLILKNEGFLKHILNHWSADGFQFDFDELYGEAMIAFYQAILHYDLVRDVSIRSYSWFYLQKLRRRFFRKNCWEEFKPEYLEDTTELVFDEVGRKLNLTELLTEAIGTSLTAVEREIVVLYFIKKFTKRHIGKLRGCSERRIGIVISNALPKLKAYLQNRGINPSLFIKN